MNDALSRSFDPQELTQMFQKNGLKAA
jgi:hypothetical protein